MSAIDAAYGSKLVCETPAFAENVPSHTVASAAGVQHHCYLCGTDWQTPVLSWVAHNRDCDRLRAARR